MASGDTKTEAMLNVLGNGGSGDEFRGCCNTKTQTYILDAIDRVQKVEDDVEEIKNNPDVVDIVGTYADLQAYDTQHLTDNDIIRVLADETHGGNSTYYRFTKNPDTWTFIGEISSGPTVVQNTGGSTTNVMSQNATSGMVFADPGTDSKVRIGNTAFIGDNGIVIGKNASGSGSYAVSIGSGTSSNLGPYASNSGIAIGKNARQKPGSNSQIGNACITIGNEATTQTQGFGAIALGAYSYATEQGQMDISTLATTNSYGYNNSQYRLLTGLYDGQSAHDAATVGQALGTDESYTIATGDWTALSASSPYTYQATVTATYTIGNSTIAELLNDAPVTFATYGFAIGAIAGQTVTIYSIGQPSASVTLKVNYKG